MKISILLPYKENFSQNYAGAVSLFVKDLTLNSSFKNKTLIFGNTNYKKFLSSNYINLDLNKKFYKSSSKIYVDSFLQYENKRNSDILEVHNRPNYIKFIKEKFKNRLILYFHNDPLTMNGSKSVEERLFLLNNIDQIIFNSKWSRNRFFINIKNKDFLFKKTSICYQSTSRTKIDFKKKQKIISFIGKLNKAKGYDLFGQAITQILDKYNDWKAVVIGDEPREQISFKHKNLIVKGFKSNDYILNFLKSVSISVVCSKWNEPFGRTSLEAASRGAAVIISNKGGLPETSEGAIILNSLTVKELFNKLDYLITNKKKLSSLQHKVYKTFKFDHKFIAKIIDNVRIQFQKTLEVKNFNILKKPIFKILHITNFNDRFDGRLHYNTGKRINNGFIRCGHNVLSISDRDIISKGKSIYDLSGGKNLQKKIIHTFNNFRPDIVVLGHADAVSLKTLDYLKSKKNDLKITQWFLDPLSIYGPDHIKNKKRITDKLDFIDTSFITTDPNSLSMKIKDSFFMPNPCDHSFETLNNFRNNCVYDVFFAMSHGVHRGELKKGKVDKREIFINKLLKMNEDIKFDIYGMNNVQPIWGENFMNKIANSSMGINLSRGKPIKYYSSDRLAQLLGNGLLTFIDEKTFYSDFFSNKEMVFYKDINDLSYKLSKYKKDVKKRKTIAKNGKKAYFKYFNSTIISDFILSKTFQYKSKSEFIWNK